MPCAYPGCQDAFQAKRGIRCEKCAELFHRKCVKQPTKVQEFLCSQCTQCDTDSSNTSDSALSDTSFMDFSDFEQKIAKLEEEVKSLHLIISLKDKEIHELKEQSLEKDQGATKGNGSADLPWIPVQPTTKGNQFQQRRHSNGDQTQPEAVPTRNRFQPLENIQPESEHEKIPPSLVPPKKKTVGKPKPKKKLLFLADSHGRYCAEKLTRDLGHEYDVCTIFKPNAKLNQVIEDIDKLTKDFTVKDAVIIQGGTNDIHCFNPYTGKEIAAGTAKALALSKKTKVILNAIPGRCDNPQMNQMVDQMNGVFQQTVNMVTEKCSENVIVHYPTGGMDRSHFSQYGVHLSRKGKDLYCNRLITLVKEAHKTTSSAFFSREEYSPRVK